MAKTRRPPRVRQHVRPTEQTQLALALRTVSRHDPRRFTLRVLNALLGECMSSRLFVRLREDHALAYDIHSAVSFFADGGDLAIYAGTEPDKLEKVLTLIVKELHTLATRPPSLAEVRRARDYAIGQFDLALEGTEARMTWLGEQLLGYGQLTPAETTRQHLAAVTPRQISTTLAACLQASPPVLALVTPQKVAPISLSDALAQLL